MEGTGMAIQKDGWFLGTYNKIPTLQHNEAMDYRAEKRQGLDDEKPVWQVWHRTIDSSAKWYHENWAFVAAFDKPTDAKRLIAASLMFSAR
jgi:hypothetical protein